MNITDNIKHIPARMMAILAVAFVCVGTASAQSHGDHVMLGVGGSYPRGVEATVAYEHEQSITVLGSILPLATSNMRKTRRQDISPISPSGTATTHGRWAQPTSRVCREEGTIMETSASV